VILVVADCNLLQCGQPTCTAETKSTKSKQRNDNDDRYLISETTGTWYHWIPTRPIFTWDELVSGANWHWGELTLNPFKCTQYGRSVRLQHQLQLNIRPTIHEVFPGTSHPGKWPPRKQLSGKATIRESSFQEKTIRES